jgi:hypothetical protein
MTTLAVMKARIVREIRRSNIDTDIAAAITTAIEQYQSERWYFNETRDFTFATVANQEVYDSDDDADLANIIKFDHVNWVQSANAFPLDPISPERIEYLNAAGTFTGDPQGYCWYGEQFRIYPIPSAVYTIRISCVKKVAAPASDGEASNRWMTDAELLIRCRAKYELYTHVLLNAEASAYFDPERDGSPTHSAYTTLKLRTNRQTQQGGWALQPTQF